MSGEARPKAQRVRFVCANGCKVVRYFKARRIYSQRMLYCTFCHECSLTETPKVPPASPHSLTP